LAASGTSFATLVVIVFKIQLNRNYMKTTYLLLGSAMVLGVALISCTKNPLSKLTAEESRIYVTNYDSSANFSSFQTFSISDSIAFIDNGVSRKVRTAVDQAFIAAVRSQMSAVGYTEVNRGNSPDVGVNITRINNTSTGVLVYNNFYGGYGGFYDPFYWGYGGFGYAAPNSFATFAIKEGALTIDLLDLKDAAVNKNINIIWTGLIRGSGIFSSNANVQVKALFDQSPYLRTN